MNLIIFRGGNKTIKQRADDTNNYKLSQEKLNKNCVNIHE